MGYFRGAVQEVAQHRAQKIVSRLQQLMVTCICIFQAVEIDAFSTLTRCLYSYFVGGW